MIIQQSSPSSNKKHKINKYPTNIMSRIKVAYLTECEVKLEPIGKWIVIVEKCF